MYVNSYNAGLDMCKSYPGCVVVLASEDQTWGHTKSCQSARGFTFSQAGARSLGQDLRVLGFPDRSGNPKRGPPYENNCCLCVCFMFVWFCSRGHLLVGRGGVRLGGWGGRVVWAGGVRRSGVGVGSSSSSSSSLLPPSLSTSSPSSSSLLPPRAVYFVVALTIAVVVLWVVRIMIATCSSSS
jgi:hypothetical protein